MCSSVVNTAQAYDSALLPKALSIKEKFKKALTLFAKCHTLYDGKALFTQEDIIILGAKNIYVAIIYFTYLYFYFLDVSIRQFVEYYRTEFPTATFLPKLHFLEDHILPWVKQWQIGCGIMGEQGAESLHSCFNNTEKAYNNMRDRVESIKVLLQNHLLQIHPTTTAPQPQPLKKRTKLELEAAKEADIDES